jgi:rhomboid protease GluP
LLSATLLHGGITHLVFNSIGLLLGGALLEVTAGAAWMLLVYVVSGMCGSLLGIYLNQPNVVSVGASGAIMGLLAAVFVVTFRMPAGRERTNLQGQVARFLVPSLLPLASSASGGKVDYSAHVGGALGGALLGLLMVLAWDPALQRPRFRRGASVLALVGALLLGGSGVVAIAHAAPKLEEVRLRSADVLVGDHVIPDDFKKATETVDVWGKDRPRDPRVHLYRGMRALDNDDAPLAERELRLALAEKLIFSKFFENGNLEGYIRTILCELLIKLGRQAEAAQEAQPVCRDAKSSAFKAINDLELCGGTAPATSTE